jgi:hypothetical protein
LFAHNFGAVAETKFTPQIHYPILFGNKMFLHSVQQYTNKFVRELILAATDD